MAVADLLPWLETDVGGCDPKWEGAISSKGDPALNIFGILILNSTIIRKAVGGE